MGQSSLSGLLAADPSIVIGVLTRMIAAVAAGGFGMFPQLDMRVRGVVALTLAAVALPAATSTRLPELPSFLPLIFGEALVGFGLGLVVAIVFAAASWAGGIAASVAGLSWSDDFSPDGNPGDGGGARLASWLAVAGFLAAGGHLAIIAGLIESVGRCPVGLVGAGHGGALFQVVVAMPSAATELAWNVTLPAVAAVLTFHVAIAICLRTIRFTAGQGVIQAAASIVLLAAILQGTAMWTDGFAVAAMAPIERALTEIGP